MAETRKIVKVFLASPGDLRDERLAAKAIVDEFNSLTADDLGYQVELIGWEETVATFGRPQATINLELARCELFIGMMWKKWGTAPDIEGPYTSGFEEEFELSLAKRRVEGKPEISLYFKEIGSEFMGDPGDDLKKVIAFKEQLIAGKEIYYEQFADLRDFEKKIWRCIWTYIGKLRKQDAELVSAKSQAPAVATVEVQKAASSATQADTPLSKEGAAFLRGLISRTEKLGENSGDEEIEPQDVARFRLLSNILQATGNDIRALGVHDANLLFAERKTFDLGGVEIDELIDTGLRNLKDENVPLWHWLATRDEFHTDILFGYSIVGSKKARIGAIDAMRRVAVPLPGDDRPRILDTWLSSDADSDLKVSALKYLGDYGVLRDLEQIRQEFDKNDNKTASAAAEAIIRIRLRESRDDAIAALYELQPASLNSELLEEVFSNAHGLPTELLTSGIGHRNAEVRLHIVRELRSRDALTAEVAEQLLSDSDTNVTYEALVTLVDAGRQLSMSDAKKSLVKTSTPRGLRLGGLMSAYGASRNVEAEHNLELFREHRLRAMKDRELKEVLLEDSIFEQTVWFVLAERHSTTYGTALRQRIDDQWGAVFARGLEGLVERHGAGSESVETTKRVEKFARKELTRRSLDILCQQGHAKDLARVRAVLRSDFVDYSESAVEYLRRFGEWEDIPLIVAVAKRAAPYDSGGIMWGESDDAKYKTAARAIYDLGRERFAKLVEIPMPEELLAYVLIDCSDKVFKGLGDAFLLKLLRLESEVVRKATSLRCIRALPKKRVDALLNLYMDTTPRYYNAIHWLDFGVSTPREQAIRGVDKVTREQW